MTASVAMLTLIVTAQPSPLEPGHRENPVYRDLRGTGWAVGSTLVTFPAPSLHDGDSADSERAVLKAITGSDRAAAEFTRDSVSAPFVLKTSDLTLDNGDLVRRADLWFVVRAELRALAIDKNMPEGKGETVEAGNMKFRVSRVPSSTLLSLGIKSQKLAAPSNETYAHRSSTLLDRIGLDAIDHVAATHTQGSSVIASQTDLRFSKGDGDTNQWWPYVRKGANLERGSAEPYPGGASLVKISRLATVPGALLVEAHFAFVEPKAWFDGAPILRSKFSVVAQDRIRALRRELAKSRDAGTVRSSPESKGR